MLRQTSQRISYLFEKNIIIIIIIIIASIIIIIIIIIIIVIMSLKSKSVYMLKLGVTQTVFLFVQIQTYF